MAPLARGALIFERIVKSHELANYMFELGQAAYNSGRKEGYSEGMAAVVNKEKDYHFELFKEDCSGKYAPSAVSTSLLNSAL
ncbi:hypothetical protein HanRHA438_Chr06g0286601 [Helianthus annuus]|nr:hypothetical protein HanHA300_Chr06g0227641 [Helianthus annuus]KAJ0913525.1 hypothetical protein HanRHA438_Chr06g0286601 [Helianthus annuus]